MTTKKQKTRTNRSHSHHNSPAIDTAALLRALFAKDERLVKMHPAIPESTRDIIKIVAARRRVDMIHVVREILVEWARAKHIELLEELRAMEVSEGDLEQAKKAVGVGR